MERNIQRDQASSTGELAVGLIHLADQQFMEVVAMVGEEDTLDDNTVTPLRR